MASLLTLTSADPGNPPVVLSPYHVVSVQPRRQIRPDVASQTNFTHQSYSGAKVRVVTGEHHNVIEDHDVVAYHLAKALSGVTDADDYAAASTEVSLTTTPSTPKKSPRTATNKTITAPTPPPGDEPSAEEEKESA
jgi:hypothetical protein